MKFSESWLRELIDPPISSEELLEKLTMAGLEVEAVASCDPGFSGVVVARVEKLEVHPDAENLKVCHVEAGSGGSKTVVCGADNVQAGHCYPYAGSGAVLPGGINIGVSDIRGVKSEGMLCSEKELGLSLQASGLFELNHGATPGSDLKEYLGLDDNVIEISLTPNRGDCLSLRGIAREIAVLNQIELEQQAAKPVTPTIEMIRSVQLSAGEDCPRYCGRIIRNVDVSRPAPDWVTERLRRSDIRSINVVVDLTNYVMLETGQPMHAFDDDKLKGTIDVRIARGKESLVLLDEQRHELTTNTLVICDDSGPVAMAGIMGGLETAVSNTSSNIFLESAFFSPQAIMGRARQYGLHTDASHRYERGVNPQIGRDTMERLTGLILQICGGQAGPVTEAVETSLLPAVAPIILRAERIQRLLGMSIPNACVADILRRLGFGLEEIETGWRVSVPPYRFDVEIEADLIEEIARIHGYHQIAGSLPKVGVQIHRPDSQISLLEEMMRCLTARGYREAITYSFVDQALQDTLLGENNAVPLLNPISTDMAVMRQSLWPGLIQGLVYNLKRQQPRARLFEAGKVFKSDTGEQRLLAGVIYGNIYSEQWGMLNRSCDFYDIKSDVESLLATSIDVSGLEYQPADYPALHPGQTAEISLDNQVIGVIGALHPSKRAKFDLQRPVFLFELDLSLISLKKTLKFTKISKYPSIRRDISVIVDEKTRVIDIVNCVKSSATEMFHNLELFDVYQGEGIEIGKKSLALSLTFRRSSSTLTDEEADIAVGNILNSLYKQFGATLRE